MNSEISSQLITNIYSAVSELETLAYFEYKLRTIVFRRFLTLLVIQYLTSMHDDRCSCSGVADPDQAFGGAVKLRGA